MPVRRQKSAFLLLFIYKWFQFFAFFYTQQMENAGKIMFDRIGGQRQLFCNFLIGPAFACEHGYGVFHGRQFICNRGLKLGIMNSHPTTTEGNNCLGKLSVTLRFCRFDAGFNLSKHQPMMFDKRFQKSIRFCHVPCFYQSFSGLILLFQVDQTHNDHAVEIFHGNRIAAVKHQKDRLA